MIDANDVFDRLEAIFFETAQDNLDALTLNWIRSNPQQLSMEIHEHIGDSWSELFFDKLEPEEWIEAGFYMAWEGQQKRVALFLLNTDMAHEKECHIQWFSIS